MNHKTYFILPGDTESKNGLLEFIGDLESFFPNQIMAHDALVIETEQNSVGALLHLLQHQVSLKSIEIITHLPNECEQNGTPLREKRKKHCLDNCYMKDYLTRQLEKESKSTARQARTWRIESSGKYLDDISRLLKNGKLVLGEQLRHKDGRRYQVVQDETGKLKLEYLWSYTF